MPFVAKEWPTPTRTGAWSVATAIVRIRSGRMTKAIVSRSHGYVFTPFLSTIAAFRDDALV